MMFGHRLLGPTFAATLLVIAGPALAQAQTDEQETAAAELGRNELICVVEPVTGSRIPRRTCRTHAQIDEERERGREFIERDNAKFDQTWPPAQ